MPGLSGQPIVDRALVLQAARPHAPSLEVLDAAMEGQRDTHPDFECDACDYGDWLDPPSPFAELLHHAFGMHLPEADVTAESPRWQAEVIEAFADRYGLWR